MNEQRWTSHNVVYYDVVCIPHPLFASTPTNSLPHHNVDEYGLLLIILNFYGLLLTMTSFYEYHKIFMGHIPTYMGSRI